MLEKDLKENILSDIHYLANEARNATTMRDQSKGYYSVAWILTNNDKFSKSQRNHGKNVLRVLAQELKQKIRK